MRARRARRLPVLVLFALALAGCRGDAVEIPRAEHPERLDAEVRSALERAAATVARTPDDADAWSELGLVFHAHEFYDHARRCYERAWSLDPSRPQWPYYVAVLAAERGEVEQAAALFESVAALAPERGEVWIRLGDARLVAGDLAGAEEAFEEAVRRAPGQPWGYAGLGRTARQRGDLEGAASAFARALELEPRDRQSSYALATTLMRLGREEEAERALARYRGVQREARMKDPWIESIADRARGVQSRVDRGTRLARHGSFDEAEGLFREALESNPREYTALVNLATILLRRGVPDEAAALFERAVALRPEAVQPRVGLASALAASGQSAAARELLVAVLNDHPGDPAARSILERLDAAKR